jgi:flagellar FliJ protein
MAKFAFKLEPLLAHRRHIEDDRQRALAQLLREKLILETQIRNHQHTISDDKRSMSDALVGQVNVDRIRQHAAHSGQVAVRLQQIAYRLLHLNRTITDARNSLLEAVKQRKAVELLREKQFKRWKQEQDRREARELDEIGTQMFMRRRAERARREAAA